jgi:molybdopterin synthase catalytic subunit
VEDKNIKHKKTEIVEVELYDGGLNIPEIFNRWYLDTVNFNIYGAMIPFVGIIRAEDNIDGLSFDIYEPLLKNWFAKWQEKAKLEGAFVRMAHSKSDVLVGESSYISAVISPKRKVALRLINEFVEDFKANAPIWKYDLKNSKRIYALNRSTPIQGSGILKR